MSGLRALVAEDEAPQRASLIASLRELWPELDPIDVCEDGDTALEAVDRACPAVAFLDIRMPGASGLEVAREVVAGGGQVVFVTAFDRHAVEAFEAGAVDYLLKPVQRPRLAESVQRLQARLAQPAPEDLQARLDRIEARLRPPRDRAIRWISASLGDSLRLIGIDEVIYFQAQDKYVRVVTAQGEALIRTPIRELVDGLDDEVFWQVHRSVLVRVAAIDCLRRDELGKLRLHLRGRSETLPVSSAYAQRFRGM